MEDTKKTRKTSNSKNKNKNNHEPKWKAKKEGTTQTTKKVTSKKKATKKEPKEEIIKKIETTKEEPIENKKINEEVVEKEELKEAVVENIEEVTEKKEEIVEKVEVDEKEKEDSEKNEVKEITVNELKELVKETEDGIDKEELEEIIEKTIPLNLPKKEELDKVYENIEEESEKIPRREEKVINKSIFKKKHYNYLSRICTLIAMIILFLVLCVIFIFKALDYQLGGSTTYSEYTSNDYIVCTNDVSVYNAENCLGKDLDYISSLVKNVHVTFNYEAAYNKKYSFKSSYSVVAKLKIYEQKDSSRVRYTKDDTLINNTTVDVSGEIITFSADADINFNEYRKFVQKYIDDTGISSSAEVEVGLYLKDGDVSRKISYLTIPLTEESFMIKASNLDNQNQLIISNSKTRTIDPFYVFIAVICLLMDILLFTYLANFMYMVDHLDNEYNAKLKKILKEYDELIVNATSDYTISEEANVIKVESFEELMDARNTLEKPIVYERINNIKSKFYVEDGNTIYVYTMKDDGE